MLDSALDSVLDSVKGVDVAAGSRAGQGSRTALEGETLEEGWRKRLETAGNVLCRLGPDEASSVSVLIPLRGKAGEVERLETLGRRLANERELVYRARVGVHSITITYSNRV